MGSSRSFSSKNLLRKMLIPLGPQFSQLSFSSPFTCMIRKQNNNSFFGPVKCLEMAKTDVLQVNKAFFYLKKKNPPKPKLPSC